MKEKGAEMKHETRKEMDKNLKKGNIVVAVFYAIVVSIIGSNVAALTLKENGDSLLLAFAAFCFYSGYFFDDLKQWTSSLICPWVVSAWACFIIQATTIQRPIWSAVFGAIGLLLITTGLLFDNINQESGNHKWRWITQNLVAFALLVGYILISIVSFKLIVKNVFETIKAWPFHRQFLLVVAILSFAMLPCKLFLANKKRGDE